MEIVSRKIIKTIMLCVCVCVLKDFKFPSQTFHFTIFSFLSCSLGKPPGKQFVAQREIWMMN